MKDFDDTFRAVKAARSKIEGRSTGPIDEAPPVQGIPIATWQSEGRFFTLAVRKKGRLILAVLSPDFVIEDGKFWSLAAILCRVAMSKGKDSVPEADIREALTGELRSVMKKHLDRELERLAELGVPVHRWQILWGRQGLDEAIVKLEALVKSMAAQVWAEETRDLEEGLEGLLRSEASSS